MIQSSYPTYPCYPSYTNYYTTRGYRRLGACLTAIPIVLFALLIAPPAAAEALTITVANVASDEGHLMISIVDSKPAYEDNAGAVASFILPARKGTVTFSADSLPTGKLAIRVMHDQNDNEKLDSNMLGIPREPFGFSNDATGNFGPPKWDQVNFDFTADTAVTINLSN